MSPGERVPPGWSAGDLRIAAASLGWPPVVVGGRLIAGERVWRQALESADEDEREVLHQALEQVEDETDDAPVEH
jgi:hypothetical protein